MKIKKIISRNRRDFTAIYVCEHCSHEYDGYGYNDASFHDNVIPNTPCQNCGKKSGDDYQPLNTKYPEGMNV